MPGFVRFKGSDGAVATGLSSAGAPSLVSSRRPECSLPWLLGVAKLTHHYSPRFALFARKVKMGLSTAPAQTLSSDKFATRRSAPPAPSPSTGTHSGVREGIRFHSGPEMDIIKARHFCQSGF